MHEAIHSPAARWALDRLDSGNLQRIDRCIRALERNPYPPRELLAPLVIPGSATYPEALRCGAWRIAFRVVDDTFVLILRIGRWPPRL